MTSFENNEDNIFSDKEIEEINHIENASLSELIKLANEMHDEYERAIANGVI